METTKHSLRLHRGIRKEGAHRQSAETSGCKYVAHTLIGDPEADALVEELAPLGQAQASRLINAAMTMKDMAALMDAPPGPDGLLRESRPPARLG